MKNTRHGRMRSVISFVLCLAAAALLNSCNLSDTFGIEHPIPDGMAYEIPLAENAPMPIVDPQSEDDYLQLREGIQGGIYHYTLYYPALPDGEVFLRCFEASEDLELSNPRLKETTAVEVKGHTDFGPVVEGQQFTIYEGDWGDYYAARVEVWHKDAATGEKTKLTEKTYRVEGWMR